VVLFVILKKVVGIRVFSTIAVRMTKYVLNWENVPCVFEGYLPEEILRRKKDAFSDAVGYSWVGHLQAYAETLISDTKMCEIKDKCNGFNVPQTKEEEALYRTIFWDHYGQKNDHLISEIWRPKWTQVTDPSARLI
jgi:asparagine synthase (glutamine-hydrolysing)